MHFNYPIKSYSIKAGQISTVSQTLGHILTVMDYKIAARTFWLLFSLTIASRLSAQVAKPLQVGQPAPFTPPEEQLQSSFSKEDKAAFKSPDKVYYPETWFHFIGGNVSKEGITADLEAIAAARTTGVTLFHGQFGGRWPGVDTPITCLSPLWEDAVRHTALECQRLGLRFSMENCPGWAMSGGPWIKPSEAMRDLVWTRKDIQGGIVDSKIQLDIPQPSAEPWRDYKDITVLAFPTPFEDHGDTLPTSNAIHNLSLAPSTIDHPNWFEVTFPEPEIIRTIQLPGANDMSYAWAYEPDINIKVEAILGDNRMVEILNKEIPASNFQDNLALTLACTKDVPAKKFKVSIINAHPIHMAFCRFLSASRENNWETEAAWVLRSIGKSDEVYQQNPQTYIDHGSVQDISAYMDAQGVLQWNAPKGSWTILRIGHVNAGKKNGPAPPEGTGWECDKLSTRGADAQFSGYIGRLSESTGPLKNGLLNGMIMDSWECGAQTWTSDMEAAFQSSTGYALRKWMPALFGFVEGDQETTFKFLHDWKSVINDLFTHQFYGRMAELARQHHLTVSYETSAGDVFPGDILEYYKFADVPMCEFWQPMSAGFVGSLNFKPIKPCASAARLYGKPRVAAESFTSFDLTWDEQWQGLKEVANVNMAEGVTHLVYHTYTHNPQTHFLPPGTSFGAGIGTPFLRQQTWWKYMPYLNTYFARCSYLLERGQPVSDVLWYLGDEIDHKPDQHAPFPAGFKYDYCNPDILLTRLRVENGLISTPEGITYKVLWLPQTTHMLPQTLEKIYALVQAGAVVIGEPPAQLGTLVGGHTAQAHFDHLVNDIWGPDRIPGKRSVGLGSVISGLSLPIALSELGLTPDVSGDTALWVHRKVSGADWYFVASPKGKSFKGSLTFHMTGEVEFWNPVNGTIQPLRVSVKDGRTTISMELPQAGSGFVVFHHMADGANPGGDAGSVSEAGNMGSANQGDDAGAAGQTTRAMSLDNPWTLAFPPGWGAPAAVQITHLKPWKDLDLPAEARAFSGTATYTTTFESGKINLNAQYILDLGKVAMIAKVTLNGKELGVVWATPYQLDISRALVSGKNTLQIEVTSTWFNRLVYDARQPESQRKTWTIDGPGKEEVLRPSGLLGPVTVLEEPLQ